MTKQELQEMIEESVYRIMNESDNCDYDDIALSEAEYQAALVNESASFMYLDSLNEAYDLDMLNEQKFTKEELAEKRKELDVFKAKQAALDAIKDEKEKEIARQAMFGDRLVVKPRVGTSDGTRNFSGIGKAEEQKIKENTAKEVAKKLGNGFKASGDKVIAVFKNSDGSANKKAIGIAAAGTALAASIAAAAIVTVKKKKVKKAKEEAK